MQYTVLLLVTLWPYLIKQKHASQNKAEKD